MTITHWLAVHQLLNSRIEAHEFATFKPKPQGAGLGLTTAGCTG